MASAASSAAAVARASCRFASTVDAYELLRVQLFVTLDIGSSQQRAAVASASCARAAATDCARARLPPVRFDAQVEIDRSSPPATGGAYRSLVDQDPKHAAGSCRAERVRTRASTVPMPNTVGASVPA